MLELGRRCGLVVVVEQLCESDDVLALVLGPDARPWDGKVLARVEIAAGARSHLSGTILRVAWSVGHFSGWQWQTAYRRTAAPWCFPTGSAGPLLPPVPGLATTQLGLKNCSKSAEPSALDTTGLASKCTIEAE